MKRPSSRRMVAILLLIDWGGLILGALVDLIMAPGLPPALAAFVSPGAPLTAPEIALGGTALVMKLVGTAGLFAQQNWGRWWYLASAGTGLAAFLASGPTVATGLGSLLYSVGGLANGAILGVSFVPKAETHTAQDL